MGTVSVTTWVIIVAVGSIALPYSNNDNLIGKLATVMVVIFSLMTVFGFRIG